MAKSNQQYWTDRWKLKDDKFYERAEEVILELEKAYRKAQRELESKLSSFLGRYAKDKNLTYEETQFIMDRSQKATFKHKIGEYVKLIEETGSEELLKELDIMSGKARYRAMDELLLDIKVQADILHMKQQEVIEAHLRNTYQGNYYYAGYELQRGMELYFSFPKLNPKTVELALNYPWSGDDFSSNIWENKDILIKNLRKEVTQGLIQGKSYDEMAKRMQKRMNTSYFNANRICMTETSYIISKSDNDSFKEAEVEKYVVVATLDEDTSPICQSEDGKVYKLEEYAPGKTANPYHPH